MEDRQWEDTLKMNHRPRRTGGSGHQCWAKGCPKNNRHEWFYSYDNEPDRDAAEERARKAGWVAIRSDHPKKWVQVHGWFCSDKCLQSPEADRARQRAAQWSSTGTQWSSTGTRRTRRETPVAKRQDRIAQVLAVIIVAFVAAFASWRQGFQATAVVLITVLSAAVTAVMTRPPR